MESHQASKRFSDGSFNLILILILKTLRLLLSSGRLPLSRGVVVRRLFHALFAVVVLLGPAGVSHGTSTATREHCACCEDTGALSSCACGESGSSTPGNRPCSPDSSNRCNPSSDRVLPGRTLAIQEENNESPRPEKRKEPRPWPTVLADEASSVSSLLPNASRVYLTSPAGTRNPEDFIHRLGVLRI